MIEAVLLFAFFSALFEAVMLWKLAPRWLVMTNFGGWCVHFFIIGLNLFIHYGTVTGTMTAIVAGLASFAVLPMMRRAMA